MRKFNEMYVIGIDHGYGNMKTANCCFPTGVMKSDTEPTFVSDLLQWNGKYYSIGVGHKEFTADKFTDEDYYVLTLAAIARELRRERLTEASVFIAAGLPLTWVREQRLSLRNICFNTAMLNFLSLTPITALKLSVQKSIRRGSLLLPKTLVILRVSICSAILATVQ